MDDPEETAIGLSKKKLFLVLIGALGFVALGLWLLTLDTTTIESQRRFNEPLFVYGTGAACILFFGAAAVAGTHKLLDKKAGLVLNGEGVVDNSSAVAAGMIPWSEIVATGVHEVHKQKMLIIKVQDPQKYVQRGGILKRALNQANMRMCGSPIVLSANALQIEFPELLSLIERYQSKYRRI